MSHLASHNSPAVNSMTGYARRADQHGALAWAWEIKSVNGRGLEVRCRLPEDFSRLEPEAVKAVQGHVQRGTVTISLKIDEQRTLRTLHVKKDVLYQIADLRREYKGVIVDAPMTLDALLLAGDMVFETRLETEPAEVDAALMSSLRDGLIQLQNTRRQEGESLSAALHEMLQHIASSIQSAEHMAQQQPKSLRQKIEQNVQEFLTANTSVSPERLAQEVAFMASKVDVREEMTRLRSHVQAARQSLHEGGAVGRRLDFLSQEMMREANTLCSKAQDTELTYIGIDLKQIIEQFREQVQNIE